MGGISIRLLSRRNSWISLMIRVSIMVALWCITAWWIPLQKKKKQTNKQTKKQKIIMKENNLAT